MESLDTSNISRFSFLLSKTYSRLQENGNTLTRVAYWAAMGSALAIGLSGCGGVHGDSVSGIGLVDPDIKGIKYEINGEVDNYYGKIAFGASKTVGQEEKATLDVIVTNQQGVREYTIKNRIDVYLSHLSNLPGTFIGFDSSLISGYESADPLNGTETNKVNKQKGSVGIILPDDGMIFAPVYNINDNFLRDKTLFTHHPKMLTSENELSKVDGKEFGCSTKGCKDAISFGYSVDESDPSAVKNSNDFRAKFTVKVDQPSICVLCIESFTLGEITGLKTNDAMSTISFSADRSTSANNKYVIEDSQKVGNRSYANLSRDPDDKELPDISSSITYSDMIFEHDGEYFAAGQYYLSITNDVAKLHFWGVYATKDVTQ